MSTYQGSYRQRALKRLQRDLTELERADLTSIAAQPLDRNFFEWHVNIKATEGPYVGVYIHLVLNFPNSYPRDPPKVKICTPIQHPNVFGGWICLSMLRQETGSVPYEGWSGAYSATSVLMQLQSFLFAENIDQDGGYTAKARTASWAVKGSRSACTSFYCTKCSHSHSTPWPPIKVLSTEKIIKIRALDDISSTKSVSVDGTSCAAVGDWGGVYGEFGCRVGKVFYEVTISQIYDDGRSNASRSGQICIGFGTENAKRCGRELESIGYNASGRIYHGGRSIQTFVAFAEGDTITVALDFSDTVNPLVHFVITTIHGEEQRATTTLPVALRDQLLYPLVSFQNSRIEFNFDAPTKPSKWLMDRGFTTLEQAAVDTQCVLKTSTMNEGDHWKNTQSRCAVDWHSEFVIDDLWLWIFECLSAAEVFRAQRVCRKWRAVIAKYNVAEREEMGCYLSKCRLTERGCTETMGFGLEIKANPSGFGVSVLSQMDILSKSAWNSGCRLGVWGERLTHFLPMVMDRKHSERAHDDIIKGLGHISMAIRKHTVISNPNALETEIANNATLRLTDSLISMMNSIVVQFVMKNDDDAMAALRSRNYYDAMSSSKSISMMLCEKVVIGYSAFHHLLLYLKHKFKKLITSFADRTVSLFLQRIRIDGKWVCKNLGKLLIWTMISSKFKWKDIAKSFMIESFTRNVKWLVKQPKYAKYDTTASMLGRLQDTFTATTTSRRLIMFQVWFSRSNAVETLQSYNQRLGRPRSEVRHGIMSKTKQILQCAQWSEYFKELRVVIADHDVPDMLRFAVFNSAKMRYHRPSDHRRIQWMKHPAVRVLGVRESVHSAFPSKMKSGVIQSSGRPKGIRNGNVWAKPVNGMTSTSGGSIHGQWRRPQPVRPQNTASAPPRSALSRRPQSQSRALPIPSGPVFHRNTLPQPLPITNHVAVPTASGITVYPQRYSRYSLPMTVPVAVPIAPPGAVESANGMNTQSVGSSPAQRLQPRPQPAAAAPTAVPVRQQTAMDRDQRPRHPMPSPMAQRVVNPLQSRPRPVRPPISSSPSGLIWNGRPVPPHRPVTGPLLKTTTSSTGSRAVVNGQVIRGRPRSEGQPVRPQTVPTARRSVPATVSMPMVTVSPQRVVSTSKSTMTTVEVPSVTSVDHQQPASERRVPCKPDAVSVAFPSLNGHSVLIPSKGKESTKSDKVVLESTVSKPVPNVSRSKAVPSSSVPPPILSNPAVVPKEVTTTSSVRKSVKPRVPLHKMGGIPTVPVLQKATRNEDDLSSFKHRFGVRSTMNAPGHSISKQHAEIVQMVPFRSSSGSIEFRRTIRLVDDHLISPQQSGWPVTVNPVSSATLDGQQPSTWTLHGNGYGVCSGGIWSDNQFQCVQSEMVTAEEAVRCVINEDRTVSESTYSAETPNEDIFVNESKRTNKRRTRRRKRRKNTNKCSN
jgi:ubiquitin-protein ligase